MMRTLIAGVLVAAATAPGYAQSPSNPYVRDQKQAVDEAYTKKIREYTTAPYFSSPLVDYLPASKTVPTPQAVIGDIAGAPGKLPYSHEVYQYMRMVEKASPRVKVFSIGRSEEGREMIAVAVSSEANLAKLEENRARLGKLADPRTIGMNDAEADTLVDQSVPVYYITGTIHSPETGSPTALMELVYRLAVDESPYIQKIRNRIVTLITPIVEVDGRDRQVDIYRWHLANPGKNWPPTLYWGKYVRARQQPRCDGADAEPDPQRAEHLPRLEGAGAARPARVGRVPVRQHRRRRAVQRVARPDPHRRVADDRLEQRVGDDQVRHAGRVHARHVRHLDARLPDVHRRDAQRHQPLVRNVRQRRRRHARAHAGPERDRPDVVQAEPSPPQGQVVAAQQQQLSGDRPARLPEPFRRQQEPVPEELLLEEQAVDSEAEDRGAGRVRVSGRRSAARAAGGPAPHHAAPGLRDLARDRAVHRHGLGEEASPAPDDDHGRAGARRAERRRPAASGGAPGGRGGAGARRDAHVPRRQLRPAHGPAVQPHCRHAARLPGTGRPTIRSATPTTTRGGRSASCST